MLKYCENDWDIDYPEGWELEANDEEDSVSLFAPGGGDYWMVARLPNFADLHELAHEVADSLAAEYPGAEMEHAEDAVDAHALKGLDVDFFYLDMPCLAQIRTFRWDSCAYLICVQMMDLSHENRDTFAQITAAWVRNLTAE